MLRRDEAGMLTDRYDEALLYASALHRGQVRKGTKIPYFSHLLSVSALVLKSEGDEDQAIAGLLHDAAEDQGGQATLDEIRRRFGPRVADIVADCTDTLVTPKPPWRVRKEAYIARLPSKSRDSLLVSLADKTDNARAILGDYREMGDRVWDRFSGGKEGTRWYYRELRAFFLENYKSPLAYEFSLTVAGFMDE
jgi:(p)ppGpp synthase/HD superfamily hydrolase